MNKRNFLITAALSAAFCFFGTANAAETLKIGASPVPHADILKVVQPELAKKGIDLKIIEFSDYVQPNLALSDKDLDANFFQHLPYLDAFSKDHRLNLVSAGAVHIEPMGVYSKKVKNLADLKKGASVAIPNDPTNGGRALQVLAAAGLIKMKDGVGVNGTPLDTSSSPLPIRTSFAHHSKSGFPTPPRLMTLMMNRTTRKKWQRVGSSRGWGDEGLFLRRRKCPGHPTASRHLLPLEGQFWTGHSAAVGQVSRPLRQLRWLR